MLLAAATLAESEGDGVRTGRELGSEAAVKRDRFSPATGREAPNEEAAGFPVPSLRRAPGSEPSARDAAAGPLFEIPLKGGLEKSRFPKPIELEV